MRRFVLQLSLIATIVCACSDDQGPRPLGPNAVTQSVTSAGGTLTSKDGLVRLDIPAGALAAGRTITLDELALSERPAVLQGRSIVRLFELGPSGTTFDKPVKVTIKASSQAPQKTDSSVSVSPQLLTTVENGQVVPLANQVMVVAADGKTISGELTHFSPLALEAEESPELVTFGGVPDQAEVNRKFNVQLRVTATSILAFTLVEFSMTDRSTNVTPNPPIPPNTVFPIRSNAVSETLPYECTSVGPAEFKPAVKLVTRMPEFSARPGERFTMDLQIFSKDLDCLPKTSELRVVFEGDGGGSVTGGPAPAFTCTDDCTRRLVQTLDVQLTATPNPDSRLASFSGACSSSDVAGVSAPFRMTEDRQCIVTFVKKPVHAVTITRTGQGAGAVTGAGLNCGDNCTVLIPEGTILELRGTPATGSRFATWQGPSCPVNALNSPVVTFPVNGPVNCAAFFPLEQVRIVVTPSAPSIEVGTAQRLSVGLSDEAGPVTGRTVTFVSGNPSVATVDEQGNVTAIRPGLATIVVTVGGPGGGSTNVVVTVPERLIPLVVQKTGAGEGTTSIFNAANGFSSNFCDVDCPQVTAEFRQGSVLHVLASPGAGSTLVGFLGDCTVTENPATARVQLDEAATCTVEFGLDEPAGPLSIAFGGIYSKSTGLGLSLANVNGTVYAEYDVQNYPRGDSLNIRQRVDSSFVGACFRANLAGTKVRCEIDTSALDSSAGLSLGRFRNGLRTLNLTAQNQSGVTVATVSQPLTFNNQSFILTTTNNPVGATPTTWRGGTIAITVRPVIFDDINADNLRVEIVPTGPISGTGTLTFDPPPPGGPFVFTANRANSPTAQGSFGAAFTVLEGGSGDDITGLFGALPPFQQNIDMVLPIVPSMSMPANTFISGGALVLDFATGPYPAGTHIPLSRISGGSVIAAHLPFCASAHVHGTISIRRENSSTFDGPFSDPRLGADCGHGSIITTDFNNVLFSFGAFVTEANQLNTNVQMLNGLDGCDVFQIDDTPILQGTGPGQASNPNFTTSNNPFNFISNLNVNSSMAGQDVCFRIRVQDPAVGADGLPSNVVNRLLQTRLTPFVPPGN